MKVRKGVFGAVLLLCATLCMTNVTALADDGTHTHPIWVQRTQTSVTIRENVQMSYGRRGTEHRILTMVTTTPPTSI